MLKEHDKARAVIAASLLSSVVTEEFLSNMLDYSSQEKFDFLSDRALFAADILLSRSNNFSAVLKRFEQERIREQRSEMNIKPHADSFREHMNG